MKTQNAAIYSCCHKDYSMDKNKNYRPNNAGTVYESMIIDMVK